MQSKQNTSEPFKDGLLVRPIAAEPVSETGTSASGEGKTPLNGSGSGYQPSTEFIITPETFESITDSDQTRYEIVLLLHETCYSRVYSFLRRSVPADVADDLAQETFLRLLSHKKIERMSISISYLFRIAQNLLRRRHNRLVRSQRHLHDTLKHQQTSERNRATTVADTFEVDAEHLVRIIDQLSPNERDVLKLIVCQGLSYSAAAKVMGVPVSTVNNWKFRALSRLREFIRSDHGVERDAPRQAEHGTDGPDFGRDPLGSACKQAARSSESHRGHPIAPETGAVDFGARAAG